MMFLRDIFKWVYTNHYGYERHRPRYFVCSVVTWRPPLSAPWTVPYRSGCDSRHRVWYRLYGSTYDVPPILLKRNTLE